MPNLQVEWWTQMIRIRPAQGPDVSNHLVLGYKGEHCRPAPDQWLQPGNVTLVAVDGGDTPVGAVLLTPDRRVGTTVLSYRLGWLYVEESHRCHGIGQALLTAAAKAAAEARVTCIHVPLRRSNGRAVALLERIPPTDGAAYVVWLTHGGF